MAARERLQVVLELVASQYKREAKQAASATGQVADSATKAGTAAGGLTKQWSSFTKLAAGGALLMLGREAVQFAGQMADLGVQLEGYERRAETVFGTSIDLARKWADENNEAFGVGEKALLGMLAATGDLLVPMGFAREEALGLSQSILQAANATSEWTAGAVSVESASTKIQKAMLGEREGLADLKQRLLETGKDKLTGQALKQARAEETLNLIYEQSADAMNAAADGAAGLVDARKTLEAQKADAMEQLAEATLPAITHGFRGAAVLANNLTTNLESLFGDLPQGEKDLNQLNSALFRFETNAVGSYTELNKFQAGLADVGPAVRRNGDAVGEFAKSLDLTRQETLDLVNALRTMPEMFGMEADAANVAAAAIELNQNAVKDSASAHKGARKRIVDVAEAFGDEAANVYDLTNALGLATAAHAALTEQQKVLDPIQKLLRANAEYEESFIKVAEMQAAGETSSDEYRDASFELLDATMDLKAAQFEMAETGTDAAEAIAQAGRDAGLSADQIAIMESAVWDLSNALGSIPSGTITTPTGNIVPVGTGPKAANYHGGPANAGALYQVGERNKPELFMIPGDNGRVFSNAEARAMMGQAGGGSLVINMTSVDPVVDAQRVGAMAAVRRRMET